MNQDRLDYWYTQLSGEALLYALLGKLLYEELDQAWLETLIGDEIFTDAPFGATQPEVQLGLELLREWSQTNAAGISAGEFSRLKQDRLRHFIGLGPLDAPPWESVHLSEKHLLFQEQTIQVRDWYARFGLQLTRLHKEPDDQIGLEMSFIAHLARLAAEAINAGELHDFETALQSQREFLTTHLLRWGPSWAVQLHQHAQTDFYRGLAHLSLGALQASAAMLEIPLSGSPRNR